ESEGCAAGRSTGAAGVADVRTASSVVDLDRIGAATMAPNVTARRSSASTSAPTGTLAERYDRGIGLRRKTPRKKHADLLGPADRDPVAILAGCDRTRVPELVPVRYERMLTNSFAFLRGAAAVMAEDLRHQPIAGIAVQACGDCHLMNFGAFATPEENILFDINDFDETLPGVD